MLVLVLVVDRLIDDDAESHSFLNSIAINYSAQLNSTQLKIELIRKENVKVDPPPPLFVPIQLELYYIITISQYSTFFYFFATKKINMFFTES